MYKMSPASNDFLNLTDEQIDLEYEMYKQANPEKFKSEENYHDPEYEEWEKKSAEMDRKIVIETDGSTVVRNETTSAEGADEWDDVPVDE